MTIDAEGRRFAYAGDGVTTIFAFDRLFDLSTDLKVYLVTNATGVGVLKSIATHYTVLGAGDPDGGTVTMLTPPANTETLVIFADTPQTHDADISSSNGFPYQELEDEFDRLTNQVQEISDRVDFAVAAPRQRIGTFDYTFPIPSANKTLGVNASNNGLEWKDGGGGGVAWGSITGTLSAQTDLQAALDAKSGSGHSHSGLAPSGGTTSQVLKKNSNTDYDYSWAADDTGGGGVSDGDKGDVTVSGGGATWTVDNDAITFAKMQNISTDRLLGRDTAASGDVEQIDLNATLEFTGAGSIRRAALTGHITASAGSNATALGSFTLAELNTAISDANVDPNPTTTTGISAAGSVQGDATVLTALSNHQVWVVSTVGAGQGVKLPAITNAARYHVVNTDGSDALTIYPDGAETISGTASLALASGQTVVLYPAGTDWRINRSPQFTATNPAALGTASPGGSVTVARSDHIHPAADLSGSQVTGTLAAGRFPALTGDVTTSAGSLATTIANDAVSYAKMQNVSAASKLLGRGDSGSGDPQEITLGTNLSMSGTTLNASGGGGGLSDSDYGDVTVSGGGTVMTIDPDVVTFAKMQNIATDRLLGRDTAASGDVEEIALNSTLEFDGSLNLRRAALTGHITSSAGSNATALGSFTVAQLNAAISDADVQQLDATLTALAAFNTNGLLTQTAADTFAGRSIAGTSGKIVLTNGDGVSGNPTVNVGADIVDETIANTYTAGMKQSFTHDATNAGLRIVPATGDPSTPADGDIWYNSSTNLFKKRQNGTTSDLDTGGGGGVSDGDKGDVTVTASGATWTIDPDVVTFAKMQNITSDRLLGRDTASSGDIEEITLNSTLEFDGSLALRRAALTGDVTASAGSNTTKLDIANATVATPDILDEMMFADVSNSDASRQNTLYELYRAMLLKQHNYGFHYFTDFINDVTTTATDLMAETVSGAGAATAIQNVDATNHVGIVRTATGTTATGRAAVMSGTTALRFGGGEVVFEALVNVTTLSTSTEGFALVIGLVDTVSAALQADCAAFFYDERNVTASGGTTTIWQSMTADNNTRTFNAGASGSSTVTANQWDRLKIIVNAAGTNADFYVNDTLRYTHTTNIPTGSTRYLGFGWLLIKSVGTTSRTADVDYVMVNKKFDTAR
jgi:hypothetical protein